METEKDAFLYNAEYPFTPIWELKLNNLGCCDQQPHYMGTVMRRFFIYTLGYSKREIVKECKRDNGALYDKKFERNNAYVNAYKYELGTYDVSLDIYSVMVDVQFTKKIVVKLNNQLVPNFRCEVVSLRELLAKTAVAMNQPPDNPVFSIGTENDIPGKQNVTGLINIYAHSVAMELSCEIGAVTTVVVLPLDKVKSCRIELNFYKKYVITCPLVVIGMQFYWLDTSFIFMDKGLGQMIEFSEGDVFFNYLIYGLSSSVIKSFFNVMYATAQQMDTQSIYLVLNDYLNQEVLTLERVFLKEYFKPNFPPKVPATHVQVIQLHIRSVTTVPLERFSDDYYPESRLKYELYIVEDSSGTEELPPRWIEFMYISRSVYINPSNDLGFLQNFTRLRLNDRYQQKFVAKMKLVASDDYSTSSYQFKIVIFNSQPRVLQPRLPDKLFHVNADFSFSIIDGFYEEPDPLDQKRIDLYARIWDQDENAANDQDLPLWLLFNSKGQRFVGKFRADEFNRLRNQQQIASRTRINKTGHNNRGYYQYIEFLYRVYIHDGNCFNFAIQKIIIFNNVPFQFQPIHHAGDEVPAPLYIHTKERSNFYVRLGTFRDADAGDQLEYRASLDNDRPLPF